MLAPALIIASSAIVLLLGTLHLIYTFATDKFQPRDPDLAERMRQVSPMITRQTSPVSYTHLTLPTTPYV